MGTLSSCTIIAPWRGSLIDTSSDTHSLNEAYTLISQMCEPQRRSHTGNVFEKIHYLNHREQLRPIADRREQLEARAEYALAVLSGSWWLEDAVGLPRRWAHMGQSGEQKWIVSFVDGGSLVHAQDSFENEVEAVASLLSAGFNRLPFEPKDFNDWPPEPPYRCQNGEEVIFPCDWALTHSTE